MSQKVWKCMNCGHEFTTAWIPSHMVRCPRCGSGHVFRIDSMRGKGYGRRLRRGLCQGWRTGRGSGAT